MPGDVPDPLDQQGNPLLLVEELADAQRRATRYAKRVSRHVREREAAMKRARDYEQERDAAITRAEAADRRAEHTEEWYAVRMERLQDLGKDHGIWPEMAAIIANGTVTGNEPPTYAQQLIMAKHRAEAAERRIAAFAHDDIADCPTYYDGCHCWESSTYWHDRAEEMKAEIDRLVGGQDTPEGQAPATMDEELDTVGKRHTLTEEGDCVGWCSACRENRASGRNPDGTAPEPDGLADVHAASLLVCAPGPEPEGRTCAEPRCYVHDGEACARGKMRVEDCSMHIPLKPEGQTCGECRFLGTCEVHESCPMAAVCLHPTGHGPLLVDPDGDLPDDCPGFERWEVSTT
jgi:hypothetical protein